MIEDTAEACIVIVGVDHTGGVGIIGVDWGVACGVCVCCCCSCCSFCCSDCLSIIARFSNMLGVNDLCVGVHIIFSRISPFKGT